MKRSLWAAALVVVPAASAQASSISIANPVIPAYPTNYTTVGTYDWAHYGYDTGSSGTSYDYMTVPTGPNSISNLSVLGGGALAEYQNNGYAGLTATWTNGEFNNETNNDAFGYNAGTATGDGVQFNATIPASSTETLQVYVIANDQGVTLSTLGSNFLQLEASIATEPGTSMTNTGMLIEEGTGGAPSGGSAPFSHGYGEYAITVTNTDLTADTLNVQFALTVGVVSSSSVCIYGVTAQDVPAPEPASLGVLAVAGMGLLARRRRRFRPETC